MCDRSVAISPPENQSVMRTAAVLVIVVDRFVDAVDRCFNGITILNCHYESLFKARSARKEVLSPKNMAQVLKAKVDPEIIHQSVTSEYCPVLSPCTL